MFARLSSHLLYDGYLPYDSTGDHFFKIIEILSFLLSGGKNSHKFKINFLGIAALIFVKFSRKHYWDLDKVNCLFIIIPALIMAFAFHSNLNKARLSDVRWAFSEYLESLAMFPLIFVLH